MRVLPLNCYDLLGALTERRLHPWGLRLPQLRSRRRDLDRFLCDQCRGATTPPRGPAPYASKAAALIAPSRAAIPRASPPAQTASQRPPSPSAQAHPRPRGWNRGRRRRPCWGRL
jgi:hypothetical protein